MNGRGPGWPPALDGLSRRGLSVLLVPVGVVDELPVQLLGLLGVKLLAAIRALERARHPHPHIDHGAITGHGPRGDLHGCFRHVETCARLATRQNSDREWLELKR